MQYGQCRLDGPGTRSREGGRLCRESVAVAFEHARQHLDDVAAEMLGLTDGDLAYLQERFITDPFLSQIPPMWAHRGLHMQGYHDHSGGDRFLD